MRHALLGGGKRFRPSSSSRAPDCSASSPQAALDAAAAFECVHCYSLVHDDLPSMDNDDMRRGQPTVHKAFDEWTAILAGDALLTLAFEILARPQTTRRCRRARRADARARACGRRARHGARTDARPRSGEARRAAAHDGGARAAAASPEDRRADRGGVRSRRGAGACAGRAARGAEALRRQPGPRVSDRRRSARCGRRRRGDGQGDRQGQRRRQGDAGRPHRHRAKRARSLPRRSPMPSASCARSATRPPTLIEAAHFAASREH